MVLGQDSDKEGAAAPVPIHRRMMHARFGFSRSQREAMKASGLSAAQVNDLEAQMVAVAEPTAIDRAATPINDQPHADVEKVGFGAGMHSSVQNTGGIGQPRADRGDGTGALAPTFTEDEMLAPPLGERRPSATISPMSAQAQQTGGIAAPGTHAPGYVSAPCTLLSDAASFAMSCSRARATSSPSRRPDPPPSATLSRLA